MSEDLEKAAKRARAREALRSQIEALTSGNLVQTLSAAQGLSSFVGKDDDDNHESTSKDATDYATNEDIIQLVEELQGQLDIMEERSIRRSINIVITDETQPLAPLLDADGQEPPKGMFPENLKQFKALKEEDILSLCRFYQLLPATEEDTQQLEDFLSDKIEKLSYNDDTQPDASKYTKDDIDNLHDKLARYVGVRHRRIKGNW